MLSRKKRLLARSSALGLSCRSALLMTKGTVILPRSGQFQRPLRAKTSVVRSRLAAHLCFPGLRIIRYELTVTYNP